MPPVTKDARIDKLITWGLSAFCGLALTVGAWFFNKLDARIEVLGNVLTELRQEVAVLQVQRQEVRDVKEALKEIRSRLRELETKGGGR